VEDGVVKMIQMGVNMLPEKDPPPPTVSHPYQKIEVTPPPRHHVPIMMSPRQMRWIRIILVDLVSPPKRVGDFNNYPPRRVNSVMRIVMSATILDHMHLPPPKGR